MNNSICGYCFLYRYDYFPEVIYRLREYTRLKNLKIFAYVIEGTLNNQIIENLKNNIQNLEIKILKKVSLNNLNHDELFYNRKNVRYVKERFNKSRANFLHVIHYANNVSLLQEIMQYELAIQFDDSFFKQKISIDFEAYFEDKNKQIITSKTWETGNSPELISRRETTINLFKTVKEFCNAKNIIPKNKILKEAIEENSERLFNTLKWSSCNFNIYKTNLFSSRKYYEWINFINSSFLIFKYRWGDPELIGIYCYLYYEDPLIDLSLNKDTYEHKPEFMKIITEENILKKIYRKLKNILYKFSRN